MTVEEAAKELVALEELEREKEREKERKESERKNSNTVGGSGSNSAICWCRANYITIHVWVCCVALPCLFV